MKCGSSSAPVERLTVKLAGSTSSWAWFSASQRHSSSTTYAVQLAAAAGLFGCGQQVLGAFCGHFSRRIGTQQHFVAPRAAAAAQLQQLLHEQQHREMRAARWQAVRPAASCRPGAAPVVAAVGQSRVHGAALAIAATEAALSGFDQQRATQRTAWFARSEDNLDASFALVLFVTLAQLLQRRSSPAHRAPAHGHPDRRRPRKSTTPFRSRRARRCCRSSCRTGRRQSPSPVPGSWWAGI